MITNIVEALQLIIKNIRFFCLKIKTIAIRYFIQVLIAKSRITNYFQLL